MEIETKVVEFRGKAFLIGTLSTRQVREFWLEMESIRGVEKPEKLTASERDKYIGRSVKTVALSLENARTSQDDPEDKTPWTPERVDSEINWPTFQHLQLEVLELSGLRAEIDKKKDDALLTSTLTSSSLA